MSSMDSPWGRKFYGKIVKIEYASDQIRMPQTRPQALHSPYAITFPAGCAFIVTAILRNRDITRFRVI